MIIKIEVGEFEDFDGAGDQIFVYYYYRRMVLVEGGVVLWNCYFCAKNSKGRSLFSSLCATTSVSL